MNLANLKTNCYFCLKQGFDYNKCSRVNYGVKCNLYENLNKSVSLGFSLALGPRIDNGNVNNVETIFKPLSWALILFTTNVISLYIVFVKM